MGDNIAVRLIKDKHKRVINAFRAHGFEYADNEWHKEMGAWKVFTDSRHGTEFLNPNNPLSGSQSFKRYWVVGLSPLDSKSLVKNAGLNASVLEDLYGESLADMVEYGDGSDPDTVLNFNFPAGAKIKVQDRAEILDCIRTALEESEEVRVDLMNDNSTSPAAGRKPTDMPGRGMRKDRSSAMRTLSAFVMGNGANKMGDAQRDILKRIVNSSKTFSIYYRVRSGFDLPGEKYKHEAIDDFMRLAERYVADMPDEELYLHLPAGLLPAGDARRLLMRLDNDAAKDAASLITRLSNFASGSLDEARALAKQKDIASDTFDDEDAVNRVISELDLSDLDELGSFRIRATVRRDVYERIASFDGSPSDFRNALAEQIESLESVAKLQVDVRRALLFAQEELPAYSERLAELRADVMYGEIDTLTDGVFDDYVDDGALSDEVYDVVSDYALECFDACKKTLTERVDEYFDSSKLNHIIKWGPNIDLAPDKLLSKFDSDNESLFSGFDSFADSIQMPYKSVDEVALEEQMMSDIRDVASPDQCEDFRDAIAIRIPCTLSNAKDVVAKFCDHPRLGRIISKDGVILFMTDKDDDALYGVKLEKIATSLSKRFSNELGGLEISM